jgi:hypothetical protein
VDANATKPISANHPINSGIKELATANASKNARLDKSKISYLASVLLVFLKYAHQAKSGTAKLANVKRDVLRL